MSDVSSIIEEINEIIYRESKLSLDYDFIEALSVYDLNPANSRIMLEAIAAGVPVTGTDGVLELTKPVDLDRSAIFEVEGAWVSLVGRHFSELSMSTDNPSDALRATFEGACPSLDEATIEAAVVAYTQHQYDRIIVQPSGDISIFKGDDVTELLASEFRTVEPSVPSEAESSAAIDNIEERKSLAELFLTQEHFEVKDDYNTDAVVEYLLENGVRFATNKGVFLAPPANEVRSIYDMDGNICELNETQCLFKDAQSGKYYFGSRLPDMDFSPSKAYLPPEGPEVPVATSQFNDPSSDQTKDQTPPPVAAVNKPGGGISVNLGLKLGNKTKKPNPLSIPALNGKQPDLKGASRLLSKESKQLMDQLATNAPDMQSLKGSMDRIKEVLESMKKNSISLDQLPNFKQLQPELQGVLDICKKSNLLVAGEALKGCAAVQSITEAFAGLARALGAGRNV